MLMLPSEGDVGIQLGINGTELKVFPKPQKKKCIAVELLHFFSKYVRQSSH